MTAPLNTASLVSRLREIAMGRLKPDNGSSIPLADELRRTASALESTSRALSEKEGECERLRWENSRLAVESDRMEVGLNVAEARLHEALAALKAAREALEPFVRFVEENHLIGPNMDHSDETLWFGGDGRGIFVGDFRRARSALENGPADRADATKKDPGTEQREAGR
ncbi:hypothetical protein [Bosea sp. ASV33]|uniref:hypothetical protein n=1 Tax=Bosea sp. ASV33 TaxID=2795106 RepID=UPI0018EA4B74|nr:hypothetical protein [Bosea sp. ASV33]